MAKTAKAGATTRSFANLLGLPGKPSMGKPKAEGDKPDEPDAPKKDDKEASGARAEQTPDTEDDGKAQCALCEGTGTDEDGDKCEACDGTGEVGEGDEAVRRPGDPSDADISPEAKGRNAANLRWTRVMSHPATTGPKVAVACHLLSTTTMKAAAVVAALADVPAMTASAPRDNLYSRMNADRTPNPGASGGKAKTDDFGAMMAAAVGKVRPAASR